MGQDISGFGLTVNLLASNTLRVGATITHFADDSDPLDMASVKIADAAMGLNGDLITWAKASPLTAVLNVIPGSPSDLTLGVLADANRVAAGKTSAQDEITMTVIYQDGSVVTLRKGRITDFMPGKSVAGSSRLKTKAYGFVFEDKAGA